MGRKNILLKDEHQELVRKWWTEDSLSDERISNRFKDELGLVISKSRVVKVRQALGISGRDGEETLRGTGQKPRKDLDDSMKEMLKKWWGTGHSDMAIANRFWREFKLDISETFVQRQRSQMGIPTNSRAAPRKKPANPGPRLGKLSSSALCPPRMTNATPVVERHFTIPLGHTPVPLSQIKPSECRWPYNDGEEGVVYCGRPAHVKENGLMHSYCDEHFRLAVNAIWRPLAPKCKPTPMAKDIRVGENVF